MDLNRDPNLENYLYVENASEAEVSLCARP